MDRSYNNSAQSCGSGPGRHRTARVLAFLAVWMYGGMACANVGSPDRRAVDLPNGVRAVRIAPDANSIDLGEAAFFRPFQCNLVSERGERRQYAAIRAVLTPRDAKGVLRRSAAREARISRSAARDTLVFASLGTLVFSSDGTLSGQLRSGDQERWDDGACLDLVAMVFDQSTDQQIPKMPDARLADELALPQGRLNSQGQGPDRDKTISAPFFFYREWSPDWRDFPKPEEGKGLRAHFAVKRRFTLLLLAKSFMYDPNENPLQTHCPTRNEGAEMSPMAVPLSILGGIEPYEVRTSILPPGLRWDSRSLTLSGIPQRAGSYSVAFEIKDAQFPAGAWDEARSAQGTLGNPYQQLITTFDIRKPLEIELQLPPYSRKGDNVSAVCLCKGGPGHAIFEGLKLPPGIQIDRESGRIYGAPTQVGEYQVEVRVTSPGAADSGTAQITTAAGTWRIIEPLPTAAIR